MNPDPDPETPPPSPRPGASIFTIEGRAAPGLFVVGWLASLLGLGLVFVGALAPSGLFLYFLGPVLLTIGLIAGAGNQAIERRVRGEAYAGPSPYLVLAAAIAAVYAVGSIVGVALQFVLGSSTLPDYVVRLVGVALQAAVFIGIIRLTVVDSHALSWAEMGWRRPDPMALRDLAFGAFLALPVIGLTSIVAAIVVQLFQVIPEAPLPATGVAIGLVIQLVAGAVVAPIAEEAVFRGFAISAWQRTSGARGAVIRASLLFAVAHVLNVSADNSGQAIGLIVVGVATRLPVAFALGWLFVARRSIWAPLGLHMAFNAILLVVGELAVSGAS
ncbi:MAG TPA: CPBP family intramembrane glutamic endopeptidase [Candidatus Limnocylindrales bacterium]|nr:CPBP family intramembrane glutamic endopeptidase [Candidatus Limnocylindrales bacterium]